MLPGNIIKTNNKITTFTNSTYLLYSKSPTWTNPTDEMRLLNLADLCKGRSHAIVDGHRKTTQEHIMNTSTNTNIHTLTHTPTNTNIYIYIETNNHESHENLKLPNAIHM